MNCTEARLRLGAEPTHSDPVLEEHLAGCPDCRRFREEMQVLDQDIHRLLREAPVFDARAPLPGEAAARLSLVQAAPAHGPEQPPTRRSPEQGWVRHGAGQATARRSPQPARWRVAWALAAGLAAFIVTATLLWGLRPSASLANEVVRHVQGEPASWSSTAHPSASEVTALLSASGVRIEGADVVYARRCLFRGHVVPHLVVRTASGPWTVLVLPREHVARAQRFDEQGFAGELLPAPHGAIAVLGLTSESADLDEVVAQVRHSLHWIS